MSANVRDVCIVTWTEAEDAKLRYMWAEGFSASVIGKELGRTRNSVIGRRSRLNLKTEHHPVNQRNIRTKQEVKDKRVRRMKRKVPPKPPRLTWAPSMAIAEVPDVTLLRSKAWEPLPDTTPKLLHELGTRCCHWSVSDTEHVFCAEPANRDYGYCPTHRAMAFSNRPLARL